ncbi:gastrula zinc finger protein XlCGF64.1-like isoform X3 [Macrosteles quadrilineatus]|uniref:gastrula zinc finger protein XlCGF64.1-like isoform X3 n=1 Tax=Macrosteles quadrilineatus TaxID=74068 RepID=UPI0023E2AEB9|nr:gastrula zinc finger protein XlCGF64.1-like isoform X3 [Macrosteles quadrilineatus]XP_054277324.1 gastrula zinc finger protein XlCGF64.1-like isoform X3 [Macrosteles quadrilineatus]
MEDTTEEIDAKFKTEAKEITTEDEGGMEEMDGENIDCIVSIEAGDSPEAKNQLDCTVEILEGCDEAFENQEDLLEHKKQVNENQSKIKGPKHSCRVCGLEFKYKANWLKHEKLHDDIYHFKCKHCDITFKQRMALKSHYMYVHATEKPYQCEFCERAFKTLNNLNVHKEVHHNFSGETFSCDFCPMEFKRRCYLRRHLRTHANPDKKYTCADCGLKCRSKTDIAKHVLTHLGVVEKHFFCEICGAGFSKRAHVTRHSYTHSVEKSFACQLCDKAYRDQYSLKIHNETVHLGIIYTCELCGFKSDRYAVKKHMKRCAEGQKKFTCNVCSKEYFLKKYFEQHVSKCNSKS